MISCHQTSNISIFDHGLMVSDRFTELYNHIYYNDSVVSKWDLPNDLIDWYKNQTIPPIEMLQTYAIYHDCGKPYCIQYDDQGHHHFPNHAQVSYNIWMQNTGCDNIGWYILHDMDFHTLRGSCLDVLITDRRSVELLLMAYSEIHANASMFGGIESTSFKIKKKRLDKAFNKIKLLY